MVKETKFQKKKALLLLAVILLIIVGIFRSQLNSFLRLLYGVTIDKTIDLTERERDSFNIAVLGIGGGKHAGPDLSDTIIVANVNIKQNKVHMFSVPRDLWLPESSDKANAIYAKAKQEGNAITEVEGMMEEITGLKVDYVLVLDFEGFTKLVDHLGGIDVNVLQTLDDYNYPIEGMENDPCGKSEEEIEAFVATNSAEMDLWAFFDCRYKHLHVDAGMNHMDGQEALEFVRSRHGVGSEGSDFARSRRQQLVIQALRDKAFSLGVLLNPVKLIGAFNIIQDNIDTNIDTDKIPDFINLANKLRDGEINNYVVDEGNGREVFGLLRNPPITEEYEFKWVLIPRRGNGDFSEIHEYVSCIIQDKTCTIGKSGIITPTPSVSNFEGSD